MSQSPIPADLETPVVMTKDGQEEVVTTVTEYWTLKFDGWTLVGLEEVELPRYMQHAYLSDLDALQAAIEGGERITLEDVQEAIAPLDARVGPLSQLVGLNDLSIVQAINEVYQLASNAGEPPPTPEPDVNYLTEAEADLLYVTQVDLEAAIEDAQDAQPNALLARGKRETNFMTSNTVVYGNSGVVPGLQATIVGDGRPVEIDVICTTVQHSAFPVMVIGYLLCNGSSTGFGGTLTHCTVIDSSLYRGQLTLHHVTEALASGVSYTFSFGVAGAKGGNCNLLADVRTPLELNIKRL